MRFYLQVTSTSVLPTTLEVSEEATTASTRPSSMSTSRLVSAEGPRADPVHITTTQQPRPNAALMAGIVDGGQLPTPQAQLLSKPPPTGGYFDPLNYHPDPHHIHHHHYTPSPQLSSTTNPQQIPIVHQPSSQLEYGKSGPHFNGKSIDI